MARKSLSKKIRFEVFKRDSFSCQYCGAKAPDVVLVIDHIDPVANGGDNDILNLLTACEPCNQGKSDRTLSSDAVISKRQSQLEALQERREQLEMMLEWQRGLANLDRDSIDGAVDLFNGFITGRVLNAVGEDTIATCVRRFGLAITLECIRDVCRNLKFSEDGNVDAESVSEQLSKLNRYCAVRKNQETNPHAKDVAYLCGILRNRFSFVSWKHPEIVADIQSILQAGYAFEDVKRVARQARSLQEFHDAVMEPLKNA